MTGSNDCLRLMGLLCARLCHDLSGPLGALVGVLEVAREENPANETTALAEETVVELAQRLKLLRAAWGQNGEELDVPGLQRFADGLSASGRVRLDLSGLAPQLVLDPPAGRVVLNLLLLAVESLPGGGTVALAGTPGGGLLISIAGRHAAWPAGFGSFLSDEAAAWVAVMRDPRTLQPPLTALLAHRHGFRLSMLMPAGPAMEADAAPPLLLRFAQV